jgi:PQQ-dependent dehydrogenase (s-GDH family)
MRAAVAAVACGLFVFVSLIAQDGPESVVRGTKQFRQTEVITGLAGPYEITWGPDNMLWVTERTGKRITRVNPATGQKKVAVTIDEVLAPGGQDGLMGLALDLDNNFVYTGYTYTDKSLPPYETRTEKSPYRFLYTKIVRFTYDKATETLGNPVTLISGMPAGNDHQAGRMKIGPDRKLYYTIGDQGNDQLGNYCVPIESQRLPTQAEIQAKNYASYVGKALRLNLDGSIPTDNPQIAGVRSHVFTYGHRNPQGIDFGPDGTLYESEHGPKTDDEINLLRPGGNYGWPNVAGYRDDDSAYVYGDWSASAPTPCAELTHSDFEIHEDVPTSKESEFTARFREPLDTFGTSVTWDHDFTGAPCDESGLYYICYPTIAPSSLTYYKPAVGRAMPGWENSVIMTSLKDGTIYRLGLNSLETDVVAVEPLHTDQDRFRATIVSPDGKTVYAITDTAGLVRGEGDVPTTDLTHPGSLLAFPVSS